MIINYKVKKFHQKKKKDLIKLNTAVVVHMVVW